nr:immunoglobulin heavy chain junction region [Mus musculus]
CARLGYDYVFAYW